MKRAAGKPAALSRSAGVTSLSANRDRPDTAGADSIRSALPSLVRVTRAWRERLGDRLGERTFALVATIALELLFLAVLLSLGMYRDAPEVQPASRITTFDTSQSPAPAEEDSGETPPDAAQEQPQPAEVRPAPVRPTPLDIVPLPRPVLRPIPVQPPIPEPVDTPPDDRPRAVIRADRTYGPPDTGGRSRSGDSEIVGTAPDGEPLYAAQWFRKPTRQEMSGYLSTVEAPAWALIACKTAPRWAVVDCVPIDQYPASSNIMNAVLAAAWQFQVRPPRRGGETLVGSWVRIRISYGRS
ncbi:hypothetical protein [Alteraurantiacibacter aquimixticola]|uniref:Energy transducer TonB n=1 Tax=Alteraurantiacibacter aquimixticola TaxID=2489173 RepID=A0A4T3F394_9SPHN|nr:hypothetical protein [Alteraurantiacibacter aquimixticola]TIX50620.1 hypothetical protein E5222_10205 [Alteraurantiacibacter aquimixticola]